MRHGRTANGWLFASLHASETTPQRKEALMSMWPFGLHEKEDGTLGRVLVVDDEENIRKIARLMLTKAGYEVVEAEDGGKAVEVLNQADNPLRVDVILCDIRMPKVNGMEAIAYFRSQYPSIPIIVQTGFPDLQLATSFLKDGVCDYLVKPVEKDKLLGSVAKAMEQRRMFTT
jgi:two-component system chemotaxis response regulator CheY